MLRPLDDETITGIGAARHTAPSSSTKAWRTGSLAAEVSARIMENAFYRPRRAGGPRVQPEVPIPYAKHLEQAALPQPAEIVAAVQNLFGAPS